MNPIKYRAKTEEAIPQGLFSFNGTETLALVEFVGERKYSVSFFPKPKSIPRGGLAQRLTPLSNSRKSAILRDPEIPSWLAYLTEGKKNLGAAVGDSLTYGISTELRERETANSLT